VSRFGKPWADCQCDFNSTCRVCLNHYLLIPPVVFQPPATIPRFLDDGTRNPAWKLKEFADAAQ